MWRPFDRTSAPRAVVLLTRATRISRAIFVRPLPERPTDPSPHVRAVFRQ
jgi:hypothetical protein